MITRLKMFNHFKYLHQEDRENFIMSAIRTIVMRSQVPCWTQVGSKSVKQRNCEEFRARSQLSALKGVEGRAKAPGWD
jgi:hypothetical protein